MYSVTYSKDPWLLSRLMTDLQMEGFIVQKLQLKKDWPYPFGTLKRGDWGRYFAVYDNNEISFYSHKCSHPNTRFTLIEFNYLEVLEQIIKNK